MKNVAIVVLSLLLLLLDLAIIREIVRGTSPSYLIEYSVLVLSFFMFASVGKVVVGKRK